MRRMLQLAALVLALAAAGPTALATYIPNYCGDPCSPEGDRAGCRCEGFRDICTCINGHWSNRV